MELQELAQNSYVPPSAFVLIYLGLGEIDPTLDWMDKSFEERDASIQTMLISPGGLDELRSHPRFQALLRKMNLQP